MIDTHKVMTAQILVMSCELNCASEGFSCKFLNLVVKQSPQKSTSCDIFDTHSQPDLMIRIAHVLSNISISAKLGII
jgi:hypothetical protein